MRGERRLASTSRPPAGGSSPHARGTLLHGEVIELVERFIPACAGNAHRPRPAPPPRSVHPRMRGERSSLWKALSRTQGSSPHARGTPGGASLAADGMRFIPACAGNAVLAMVQDIEEAVHPRMRGERLPCQLLPLKAGGSSPHARGTHGHAARDGGRDRFIPACAGNACGRSVPSWQGTVHPRMRGERLGVDVLRKPVYGSSPHARGTPTPASHEPSRPRFIPACAGNAFRHLIIVF